MKARGRYFFLRMSVPIEFTELNQVGRVCRSGVGTARAKSDRWCVLQSWAADVAALRGLLAQNDLDVEFVEQIGHPAEGVTLSKQVSLFG
jgi:hypothetical protein